MGAFQIRRISTPSRIILFSFLALILCGTILLMLPFATRDGHGASFLDALFTATSATCVTGLIVHDTASYWSLFGQAVIITLIQIGGMGVITMAMILSRFSGKRIGLKSRWVMQESISAPKVGGIVRLTGFILYGTLLFELTGAVLLMVRFIPKLGILRGIWYSLFHAVSAFCNAGFDLMGIIDAPCNSLVSFVGDPLINIVITLLIIIGGLGFLTWNDIVTQKLHFKAYRLQSKLVLLTTAALLLAGFVYFFFYEFSQPQWDGLSLQERLFGAFFQSVTPRTAGFNTVDLSRLTEVSVLIVIALMLIGGSPGSTAGGFKTTTLAVIMISAMSVFHRETMAQCFSRRLEDGTLRRASALLWLYLIMALTGGCLIACIDGVPLLSALFEAASAVGTVGLTLGITADLSALSHVILIILMYLGRVGALTMMYAVYSASVEYAKFPKESITVG